LVNFRFCECDAAETRVNHRADQNPHGEKRYWDLAVLEETTPRLFFYPHVHGLETSAPSRMILSGLEPVSQRCRQEPPTDSFAP
jgi:hypothetical protein